MNREIKLRAWDKDAELWRYFTLEDAVAGKLVKFSLERFCQFTGLKDKNGKEIYEGDIITSHRGGARKTFVVEWDAQGAMFSAVSYNTLDNEIIGNVYENEDLFKL